MILVINAGSSSIKFSLYDIGNGEFNVRAKGQAERIKVDGVFSMKYDGNHVEHSEVFKNHHEAIVFIIDSLIKYGLIKEATDIRGIGHRVVQGGPNIVESKFLDKETYDEIVKATPLAPLHNPGAIDAIDAVKERLPETPNVVVFDTAFHSRIPLENAVYPVPFKWYKDLNVKRYGFHGTSYRYVLRELSKILGKDKAKVNAIICHLGNGASITAIRHGKSHNTSMGLTPLEGVMMGTRSGDIDPAIVKYVHDQTGSSFETIFDDLNKKSGLSAISGISSDMRDIVNAMKIGDSRAALAFEMFVRRIVKYIVQYQNELENNVDALVFTGGIGENNVAVRTAVAKHLYVLDTKLDETKNSTSNESAIKISTEQSKVPWWVIKTDEEKMISIDTYSILKKKELLK